ncbi:MAG: hypothetical protein QM699_11265 [Amaricoccus sp.]|uniref:hypothetical protein n=1 Tax=Amaricoccus sp. TaxID=1872485 RepID=UPI0039E26238
MHRLPLIALLAAAPAAPAAAAPRIAGAAETTFSWANDRCATWDIPDTPARAWRDASGATHLVAGSEASRASVGPDLDHLSRDCSVLYQAAGNPDPAAVDERGWIHSIFTADGVHVIALVHEEFHGRIGVTCESDSSGDCWRNSIVEISSDDGGRTFRRQGLALVAGPPYRYNDDADGRTGYFNPSNILEREGFLYVFVWATGDHAQRTGACLLRRPVNGDAADWRGWDGSGFTVRFVDPYREDVPDPAEHVCAPLDGVTSVISSVVASPDGGFVAVSPTTRAEEAGRVSGIHWMQSPDLLKWSSPELLLPVPLLWRHGCDESQVYAYPALLDPDSPSPVYATVSRHLWLYLAEIRLVDCRAGPERNLVRFPINLPAP